LAGTRRALQQHRKLFSDAELFDVRAVSFKIAPLQILEKPPALPNELYERAGRARVFFERLAMPGELLDSLSKQRNLNLCVSGVFFICAKLANLSGNRFF
jgi:hypothetical protein